MARAYHVVREHFALLVDVVRAHDGALTLSTRPGAAFSRDLLKTSICSSVSGPLLAILALNADRSAFDANVSSVGRVQAEQDVHERGLTGAILTEQTQHLARMQSEIHREIGLDIAKTLVDAAHLEQRGLTHCLEGNGE